MEIRVKEKRLSFKRKRDNYARKLKRRKVINYLRKQLRACTTHGLPYIVNTNIHWCERLFWGFSFILCIYIIFALLLSQYERYKNTPLVTSVEMDYYDWNISFPAISLCPYNKIDDEDLQMMVKYEQTFFNIKSIIMELLNYLKEFNYIKIIIDSKKIFFLSETMETLGENLESQLKTIASVSVDTLDLLNFDNLSETSILSTEDYASISLLLFKKFDNNSLTTSTNWPMSIDVVISEVGSCHVINSNVAIFDNPEKNFATKYEKSNIDLSIHEEHFFIQIQNYADIYKIFIHSPDELILSSTPSYTVKTTSFIHFGVQVFSTRISEKLRSAPISLRKCRFTDEPMSERYPVYSYNHCILECRIKMILNLCDCVPHIYKSLENEKICNLTQWQCFVQYKREILSLSALDETVNRNLHGDLPRSPRDCNCLNNCESDIYSKDQETFISGTDINRFKLSISSYPKVRVVKDTIINTYDIILRSGGVINLCIGASFISLIELLIIITKLLWYLATAIRFSISIKLQKFYTRIRNLMKYK